MKGGRDHHNFVERVLSSGPWSLSSHFTDLGLFIYQKKMGRKNLLRSQAGKVLEGKKSPTKVAWEVSFFLVHSLSNAPGFQTEMSPGTRSEEQSCWQGIWVPKAVWSLGGWGRQMGCRETQDAGWGIRINMARTLGSELHGEGIGHCWADTTSSQLFASAGGAKAARIPMAAEMHWPLNPEFQL